MKILDSIRRNAPILFFTACLVLCGGMVRASAQTVVTATKGKLRSFVSQVIEADNKTLAAWVIDPNRSRLDFSGFSPNQVKYLTAFIADVNTYKSSLNSAYSLFSSGMRGAAYYERHQGNMPFGAADEFYRTTITNPGTSNVPAFGSGVAADPHDIFTTTNYLYYTAAMFAKAAAAGDIFEVMWLDGGYSAAEMEQVIREGIQSAKYVYEGAPPNYTQHEVLKSRDDMIAAFNEKLDRINKVRTATASRVGTVRQLERKAGPARVRKRPANVNQPSPLNETAALSAADEKASREQIANGERLTSERKWAEAVEAYRQAAQLNPGSAEIQDMLGDAYMNAGRYKEAFIAYQEAVRLAPRDAETHYKLGAAYIEMGQYGDSFQPFQRALSLDPQFAEAHYGIGHAYVYLEEYEKALGFLRSAVRLAPDFAEAHYDLGLVYDALDDVTAARKEQSILEKLDPKLAKQLSDELR